MRGCDSDFWIERDPFVDTSLADFVAADVFVVVLGSVENVIVFFDSSPGFFPPLTEVRRSDSIFSVVGSLKTPTGPTSVYCKTFLYQKILSKLMKHTFCKCLSLTLGFRRDVSLKFNRIHFARRHGFFVNFLLLFCFKFVFLYGFSRFH